MLIIKNLKKTYKTKGGVEVHALDDVSVTFPENGMVFLLGKSGSGKSTLLNMIGGLDRVDSGEIIVKGKNSKTFSGADYDSYRNTYIGFIFQEYNILNEFNVEQNISLALQLQGKPNDKTAVDEILKQVDLEGLGKRKPNTLSGGQKQRVAIARALIKSPEIIMADEPTGALDSNTGKQVFETLKKLSKDKLVIVVSHDRDFAEFYGDRIIELSDGKIISDTSKEYVKPNSVNENVHIINEHTVAIKDTSKLSKGDMDIILNALKSQSGEAVISSGDHDLALVRQAIHLNKDNSSEVFKETTSIETKEYNPDDAKFIRSKLPFSRAFKMGSSSLKTKPVRLGFTILLTATSLAMFGLSSTLMLFKESYSVSRALQNSVYESEVISKYYNFTYRSFELNLQTGEASDEYAYASTTRTTFDDKDIASLNDNKVGHNFAGLITFNDNDKSYLQTSIQLIDNNKTDDYYFFTYILGFSDAGESYLNSTGMNLVAGKYPTANDEMAISLYQYELLKQTSLGINNYNDILNKEYKIYVSGNMRSIDINLKVVGVYNSDPIPSKFDDLKGSDKINPGQLQELQNDFKFYLTNSYQTVVFVSNNFFDRYKGELYHNYDANDSYVSMATRGLELAPRSIDYDVYIDSYLGMVTNKVLNYIDKPVVFNKDGQQMTYVEPTKNQIYVGYEYYQMIKENMAYDPSFSDTVTYYKTYDGKEGELEIIGLVDKYEYILNHDFVLELGVFSDDYVYVSTQETEYKKSENPKYAYAITHTEFNQNQVDHLLMNFGSYGYDMTDNIYENLTFILYLISTLKKVFLISGIVFGVFAALMLFNFISTSIAAKTKEIGILRAVGARGNDLFKIFFSESGLIALICSIIAIITSAIVCWRLNVMMYEEVGLSMLDFGILNIGLIFVGAIIIAVIGTFVPVILAAKKPPVESIRTL